MPTDFDLPYRDLPLETPDGVKLRCYLLTQRKELPNIGAMPIESPDEESNEEVRFPPHELYLFLASSPYALVHIPRRACFIRDCALFTVIIEVLKPRLGSRAAPPTCTEFDESRHTHPNMHRCSFLQDDQQF